MFHGSVLRNFICAIVAKKLRAPRRYAIYLGHVFIFVVNISITDIIRKKRMNRFGDINRLPNTSYVLHMYKREFSGPRPRGHHPKRWEDQIKSDTGLPLHTAEKVAKDRGE